MEVSQVAPYSSFVVSTPVLTKAKTSVQPARTTELSASKAYNIELSDSAQARSMKLQGLSVTMISIKLGLDADTVKEFLGVTNTTTSTYVEPKRAYTEPNALAKDRTLLFQGANQLTMAEFTWSNTMNKLLLGVNTAAEG